MAKFLPFVDDTNNFENDLERFLATVVPQQGNRTVFLGDSITLRSSDLANGYLGKDAWPTWACLLSGSKIRYAYNAGVAGNTTAQMLARVDTDVIAENPAVCTILGGTNDVGTGVPLATTQANLQAIVAKLRANRIRPVIATLTPRSDLNTGLRTQLHQLNAWITWYAGQEAIPLLDFYSQVVDPATETWKSGLNADAIHPNEAGAQVLGQYAATVLAPLYAPWTPNIAKLKTDPTNLLANGLFLNPTSGVAESWTKGNSGGTQTWTVDSTDTAIVGNWQVITVTAAATYSQILQQFNPGPATAEVGDVLAFTGRFKTTGLTGGSALVRVNFLNGAAPANIGMVKDISLAGNGIFYLEGVVPAGTTRIDTYLTIGGGATGAAQVAQLALRNLTKLGLA